MWFTSAILALSLTAAHAARSSAVDTQHAQRALLAAEFPLLTAGGPEAAAASMRRLQFLREQKKRPAVEPVEQEEEESPEEIEDIVQCTTHTTEVEVEIEDNGDIHAEASAPPPPSPGRRNPLLHCRACVYAGSTGHCFHCTYLLALSLAKYPQKTSHLLAVVWYSHQWDDHVPR